MDRQFLQPVAIKGPHVEGTVKCACASPRSTMASPFMSQGSLLAPFLITLLMFDYLSFTRLRYIKTAFLDDSSLNKLHIHVACLHMIRLGPED